MGYAAGASASLKLSQYGLEHLDELQNIIDNEDDGSFDEIEISNNYRGVELWLCKYAGERYNEDETLKFLSKIEPFVEDGERIEYLGEDGSEWAFQFLHDRHANGVAECSCEKLWKPTQVWDAKTKSWKGLK